MGIFIVILILTSIFFLTRYLIKTFFVTNRKTEIFDVLINRFNAKINYQGYPEFQFKNRKIIVEYDFELGTRGGYEYIISLIDISDIDKMYRKKLKSEFDLIEKNNKIYIQIYSSWGYRGEKFTERLIEKISKLNSELNKNDIEPSIK